MSLARIVGVALWLLPMGTHAACAVLEPVADGLYVVPAKGRIATPDTGGRIGNTTVLIGPDGVIVIDPGPSHAAGLAVRCAVDALTPRPVVTVINTHAHPQHVLANSAFADVPILASTATAARMRERCTACRADLAERIGTAAMAGTEIILPGERIATRTTRVLGGRILHLIPLARAHSREDLVVIDLATGTLVGGDLVNRARVPEFADGSLDGAIAALTELSAHPDLRQVVPGHGPAYVASDLKIPLDYLTTLQQIAEHEVATGAITPPQPLPAALTAWGDEPERHSLNLQQAMREAEDLTWTAPRDGDGTAVP